MKTKRAGYLQQSNQTAKRLRQQNQQDQGNVTELRDEKKDQPECNGVCTVSWKPAAVAR